MRRLSPGSSGRLELAGLQKDRLSLSWNPLFLSGRAGKGEEREKVYFCTACGELCQNKIFMTHRSGMEVSRDGHRLGFPR